MLRLQVSAPYKKWFDAAVERSQFRAIAEVFTPSFKLVSEWQKIDALCWSYPPVLAHNSSQVGEAINFLDGLAIYSEEGGFLAWIHSHTLGLCNIDL